MSLILEALRKSEAERRRGSAPDLLQPDVIVPAAPARRGRLVYLALSLLVVLGLLWWRFGLQQDVAPEAAPALVHAEAAGAPTVTAAAPPAAGRPLAPVPRLEPAPPPSPASEPPSAPPTSTPAPPPAPILPPPPSAKPAEPVALGTLPAGDRKALPPLQLSMHLWNDDPARRVAILDGQRVVEGDRVGEAVVAEIRRDGVLLVWRGRRILVPLP